MKPLLIASPPLQQGVSQPKPDERTQRLNSAGHLPMLISKYERCRTELFSLTFPTNNFQNMQE